MDTTTYYIIADVHGQYERLQKRLKSIGLRQKKGRYQLKAGEKLLFLGDLVDRGKNTREVVTLVHELHRQGIAEVILGNHEFNLIGYLTRKNKRGYLRKHTSRNLRQCRATLKSYEGYNDLLMEHVNWFRSLPLFIEKEHFRVVHACWDHDWIQWLQEKYPTGLMDKEFLHASFTVGTDEFYAIERLLKGPEIRLPFNKGLIDTDGNVRFGIRYRWWEPIKGKRLSVLATKWKEGFNDEVVDKSMVPKKLKYRTREKMLFIGHYNFNGAPVFYKHNLLCLDCSDAIGNRIAVYRYTVGSALSVQHLKV